MTRRAVLAWAKEARDTIGLHRNYVRMTGDLGAGATLSQILYWFDDGKDGAQRARVERDGDTWIAKSPDELAVELGLEDDSGSPRGKVARRYVQNLEDEGLIVTAVYKFAGQRCLHIRPLWTEIEARRGQIAARHSAPPSETVAPNSRSVNSESVTSENGNLVPPQMPDSGFANAQNGNLLSTETTDRDYSSETTEGGACAPATPAPDEDAVCAVELALAAWSRIDASSASGPTRRAIRSEAERLEQLGVDGNYVRYCALRWFEEHWAGRDESRPMDRRRPASMKQAGDWVATCLVDARPGDMVVQARLAGFRYGPLFDPVDPAAADAEPWTPPVLPAAEPEPTPAEETWRNVLTALRLQMTRATFDAWLKHTRGVEFDGDTIIVEVPNAATNDWLTSRLGPAMRESVDAAAGPDVAWRFVVASEVEPPPAPAMREAVPA
ncbi:MAG: DnaA N-terminal domain-containing protein [Ardenticatenales bacterium]